MYLKTALPLLIGLSWLTPTPDLKENLLAEDAVLAQHAQQIRDLAASYEVGLVDSYRLFQEVARKEDLKKYMAQGNHINALGHEIVAEAIMQWFRE